MFDIPSIGDNNDRMMINMTQISMPIFNPDEHMIEMALDGTVHQALAKPDESIEDETFDYMPAKVSKANLRPSRIPDQQSQ